MKMIFAIFLVLTSVSFAGPFDSSDDVKNSKEGQEKIKKLRENVCANDIPKTEAVGACPECTEASSKKKITDLKIDLSKNEIQKRDFEFLRLMKKTGRLDMGKNTFCTDMQSCHELLKQQDQFSEHNKKMAEQSKASNEKMFGEFQAYFASDLKKTPLPKFSSPEGVIQANQHVFGVFKQMYYETTDQDLKKKIEKNYLDYTAGLGEVLLDQDLIPTFVELGKNVQPSIPYSYNPEPTTQSVKATIEGLKDAEKEERYLHKPTSEEEEFKIYQRQVEYHVEAVSKQSGFQRCDLTQAEIYALYDYSGSGYIEVNLALRTGGEKAANYRIYKEVLNSAISKLRPYNDFVDRGVTLPDHILKQYQVGAIVESPAYTSTSIFGGFGGAQKLMIKTKSGAYIAPFSKHAGEEEVLIPAGVKFKVLERKDEGATSRLVLEEVDP